MLHRRPLIVATVCLSSLLGTSALAMSAPRAAQPRQGSGDAETAADVKAADAEFAALCRLVAKGKIADDGDDLAVLCVAGKNSSSGAAAGRTTRTKLAHALKVGKLLTGGVETDGPAKITQVVSVGEVVLGKVTVKPEEETVVAIVAPISAAGRRFLKSAGGSVTASVKTTTRTSRGKVTRRTGTLLLTAK